MFYNKGGWLVGNEKTFIYWDKKAKVLEFNVFGYVKYFYIGV